MTASSQMTFAVTGCAGRMGAALMAEILATDGCALIAGSESPGHDAVGHDLGELAGVGALGIVCVDAPDSLFVADAVLDFTTPVATLAHARLAAAQGCILVTGTTGIDAVQAGELEAAAASCAIVWAANMSVGVNLLLELTAKAAGVLDEGTDIEIVEMHHRHKVDAPSGTSLALGRAAAAARGVVLDDVAVRARDGVTGPRPAGAIGFSNIRGGDVVGDHTVIFADIGERIELTHRAADRAIYAQGALRAARWAEGRAPGLYGMKDVLGLG